MASLAISVENKSLRRNAGGTHHVWLGHGGDPLLKKKKENWSITVLQKLAQTLLFPRTEGEQSATEHNSEQVLLEIAAISKPPLIEWPRPGSRTPLYLLFLQEWKPRGPRCSSKTPLPEIPFTLKTLILPFLMLFPPGPGAEEKPARS